MPDQEAIQRGRNFEQELADKLSGSLQPGSGNKFFAKGDVIAHGLSLSCKSEKGLTWAKIHRHLLDSIEMTYGTGNIPALALEDMDRPGEQIVVMRLSDFVKAFQEEVKIPEHHDSKGLQKRSTAEIPLMLRE